MRNYLETLGQSESTIQSNLVNIERLQKWMKKKDIEEAELCYQDIMNHLEYLSRKGNSKRTQSHVLNSIKHYMNYLTLEGLQEANPVKHVHLKGLKREQLYVTITEEELDYIYTNYKAETAADRRNKAMLGILIYQGVTTTELSKLEERHVQLRSGTILIPQTKRSNERTLKLEPMQILELHDYLLTTRPELEIERKTPSERLFISTGGGNRFTVLTCKLHKQLKAEKYGCYESLKQIRASRIGHWLKAHGLRRAQYMAGHRYVTSTERYKKQDLESLTAALKQYLPTLEI